LPAPLDQAKRDAIIADINAGHKTRNQIARDHSVSGATVTKLAAQAKGSTAFDRSQTEKAARAKKFDAALVRAQLIERLYGMAGGLLDRVESPYTVPMAGAGGEIQFVTSKLPPLRDAQSGMSAAAIAIDKALRLEDRNGDGRVDAAKSLLGSLFKTLRDAHGDSPDGSG
jgi:hypothetical protein